MAWGGIGRPYHPNIRHPCAVPAQVESPGDAGGNHLGRSAFDGGSSAGSGLMQNAEEQFAAIGFGESRSEPACWRAMRLDPPVFPSRAAEDRPEPASSQALLRWRDL